MFWVLPFKSVRKYQLLENRELLEWEYLDSHDIWWDEECFPGISSFSNNFICSQRFNILPVILSVPRNFIFFPKFHLSLNFLWAEISSIPEIFIQIIYWTEISSIITVLPSRRSSYCSKKFHQFLGSSLVSKSTIFFHAFDLFHDIPYWTKFSSTV